MDNNRRLIREGHIKGFEAALAGYSDPALQGQVDALKKEIADLKNGIDGNNFSKAWASLNTKIGNFTTANKPADQQTLQANYANPSNSLNQNQPAPQGPDDGVEEEAEADTQEPNSEATGGNEPDEPSADDEAPEQEEGGENTPSNRRGLGHNLRRLGNEIFGSSGKKKAAVQEADADEIDEPEIVQQPEVVQPQAARQGAEPAEEQKEAAKPNLKKDLLITSSHVVGARALPNAENSFTIGDFKKEVSKELRKGNNKRAREIGVFHALLAGTGVLVAAANPFTGGVMAAIALVTGIARVANTLSGSAGNKLVDRVAKNARTATYTTRRPDDDRDPDPDGDAATVSNDTTQGQGNPPITAEQAEINRQVAYRQRQTGGAIDAAQLRRDREALTEEYKLLAEEYRKDNEIYTAECVTATTPEDHTALVDKYAALSERADRLKPLYAATVGGDDAALKQILAERKAKLQQVTPDDDAVEPAPADQEAATDNAAVQGTAQTQSDRPSLTNVDVHASTPQSIVAVEPREVTVAYGGPGGLKETIGQVRKDTKQRSERNAKILGIAIPVVSGLLLCNKVLPALFKAAFNPHFRIQHGSSVWEQLGTHGLMAIAPYAACIVAIALRKPIAQAITKPNTTALDALENQVDILEARGRHTLYNHAPDLKFGVGKTMTNLISDTLSTGVGYHAPPEQSDDQKLLQAIKKSAGPSQ